MYVFHFGRGRTRKKAVSRMLEFIALIILLGGFLLLRQREQSKQDSFIDNYKFPNRIENMLKEIYPHLSYDDIQIVFKGLNEYFKLYVIASRRMIVIPSRLIDRTWFEFMQSEQEYEKFSQQAFGFFLNRSPLVEIQKHGINNDLKVLWTLACDREGINPDSPNKLPLIFVLDIQFNIDDGFKFGLSDNNMFYNVKKIGSLNISAAQGGRGFPAW